MLTPHKSFITTDEMRGRPQKRLGFFQFDEVEGNLKPHGKPGAPVPFFLGYTYSASLEPSRCGGQFAVRLLGNAERGGIFVIGVTDLCQVLRSPPNERDTPSLPF